MTAIPEELERSSKGTVVETPGQEEEQENRVPGALRKMRNTELVTVRERMGLMYGQKNKID